MAIPSDTLERLRAYQLRMTDRLKTVGVLSAPKPLFVDVANDPDALILRQLEKPRERSDEGRSQESDLDGKRQNDSKVTELPVSEAEILCDLTENPTKRAY